MQRCKQKKYCSQNKIDGYDKTSILNENAANDKCYDCKYFFSKNCKNNYFV